MQTIKLMTVLTSLLLLLIGCGKQDSAQTTSVEPSKSAMTTAGELTDEQVRNIVTRSYQYVALYNVLNKAAMDTTSPGTTGWNN